MKYTAKQYAEALYLAVSESKPRDSDRILDNFAFMLKEQGALGILNEIEKQFYNHEREGRGVRAAEVTTSRELTSDQERHIIKELNAYLGGRVELKKKVDEGLIGGIVVKVGEEIIDGSVKGNLKDLKEKLIGNFENNEGR